MKEQKTVKQYYLVEVVSGWQVAQDTFGECGLSDQI